MKIVIQIFLCNLCPSTYKKVLIFLQSKDRSKALYKELLFDGINVDVIHAERSEQQRENAIASFRYSLLSNKYSPFLS